MLYPKVDQYNYFLLAMSQFIEDNNEREIEALKSRIQVSFVGKHNIRIDNQIYERFKKKIQQIPPSGVRLRDT